MHYIRTEHASFRFVCLRAFIRVKHFGGRCGTITTINSFQYIFAMAMERLGLVCIQSSSSGHINRTWMSNGKTKDRYQQNDIPSDHHCCYTVCEWNEMLPCFFTILCWLSSTLVPITPIKTLFSTLTHTF